MEAGAGWSVCPFWPGKPTASQPGESSVAVRSWGLLSQDSFLYHSPGEHGYLLLLQACPDRPGEYVQLFNVSVPQFVLL